MPMTRAWPSKAARWWRLPRATVPVVLLIAATWTACGGSASAPASDEVTRTDSAGVSIVTSPDAVATTRRLASAPRVSIGQLDGPEELQLFQVRGAHRLDDGRLWIANAGSHELRLYGPDGAHLRSVGGEGEGPGEFTVIGRLDVAPGDSLVVWDRQQFRLSVFDPEGEFVRDFTLDAPSERAFPGYTALFGDGTLMVSVGRILSRPPEDGTVLRRESSVLRYDAEGHVVDTVATFTTRGSTIRSFADGQGFSIYSIPFDPGTGWAIDGAGLHASYGPRFEVRRLDATGSVTRISRIARAPTAVDAELREAAIEAQLADYTDDDARERAREAYAMIPFPDSVAAYDQLHSDASGRVWARRHPLPGQEDALWDVLDPTGALEAIVAVPASMTVWQVGEGFLLVSEQDEFDVERVAVYDFTDAS